MYIDMNISMAMYKSLHEGIDLHRDKDILKQKIEVAEFSFVLRVWCTCSWSQQSSPKFLLRGANSETEQSPTSPR